MLTLYPWQSKQWQQLESAKHNNRLSHALLLSGPSGMGKNHFAHYLSASLLCFAPLDHFYPCNQCKSCILFNAGNHPDFYFIQPENEGKQIKVDHIRELIEFINLKSQYEGYKIIVIDPADVMNRSAANTLLKTLEEPPALSIIILVSHRADLLPVTIRSRCQQIRFKPAINQKTLTWLQTTTGEQENAETLLKITGGAPLAAVDIHEQGDIDVQNKLLEDLEILQLVDGEPVKTAEKWNGLGASRVFQWLMQIINDMVRLKANVPVIGLYHPETTGSLQRLTNELDLYKLTVSYALLLKNYGLCTGQVSFNTLGLLEDFIIFWQAQFNST